jgi:hypothetical protein
MKNGLLLIMLVLMILLPSVIVAADEPASADDRWFWAWREATGELVAYNLQGDTNTILTGMQSSDDFRVVSSAVRLDADRMIAILKVNEDTGLYLLAYDSATLFDDLEQSAGYYFLYAQLPYVVMVAYNDRSAFYLLNGDTGAVMPFPQATSIRHVLCTLSGMSLNMNPCLGISRDGTKLRYMVNQSVDSEEPPIWSLVERDLITGAEHEFFAVDDSIRTHPDARHQATDCQPDRYGDRWLCSVYAESSANSWRDYFIVYPDGTRTPLLENNPYMVVEAYIGYDDEIVIDNPVSCEDGVCYFEIYPAAGGAMYEIAYQTGSYPGLPATHFRQFDTGQIMRYSTGYYALFRDNGKIRELGRSFCCESYEVISPDLRWLVSSMDNHWYLWNLAEGRRIAELDDSAYPFYDRIFSDYGLVMAGRWVYRFGDEAALEIPEAYTGKFFNVVADRTLLYHQDKATESLEVGIYRYNPETDAMTLLLAGATPIFQEIYDDRRA